MPGMMELVIILGIVILVFGTKKIKNLGGDMGGAINSFKNAIKSEEEDGSGEKIKKSISEDKKPIDVSAKKT